MKSMFSPSKSRRQSQSTPSSARISRKGNDRRVSGNRKITTKTTKTIIRKSRSKMEFSSAYNPSGSSRNSRSRTYEIEEVVEEFTDSILDELDCMESQYYENQTGKITKKEKIVKSEKMVVRNVRKNGLYCSRLFVPCRTSVDSIMNFFGTTCFEMALSEYRTKIFNSEVSKDQTIKPIGYCFQSRSHCWGENEVYSQFIVFTKNRILKCQCSCVKSSGRENVFGSSKCVHCCAQLLFHWVGNDAESPQKLFELTVQLKELRKKYSSLLAKYDEMRKKQLVPPPPQLVPPPSTPKMNLTTPRTSTTSEVIVMGKELFGNEVQKSVSWKVPLTETIASQEIAEENKDLRGTGSSSVRKTFSVLMNFNEGKALVPKEILEKKRKRHSQFYDGIPEKTDNLKKRKID